MGMSLDRLSDVSSERTAVPDEPATDAVACLADGAASGGSGGCEVLAELSDNDLGMLSDDAGVVAAVIPRSAIPPVCGPSLLAEGQGVPDARRPSPYAGRQWLCAFVWRRVGQPWRNVSENNQANAEPQSSECNATHKYIYI